MKLDRLHEAALHQLTGCRYAVLHALHAALFESIPKTVRGRPIRRTLWAQIVLTLIKLRLDLPYRTIEVMFRIGQRAQRIPDRRQHRNAREKHGVARSFRAQAPQTTKVPGDRHRIR